jgi:RNA polymerase sigma factor (sigma-70 family)
MDAPVPVEALLAHREWVRAVARAVVRDPNAADDLEQETWLAALRSPPKRDASLRGWLGTVVRSRARRRGREDVRRVARESAVARTETELSAAQLAEIADTHRRVVEAVVELPEPYRQTILLRYFEGLVVSDVAARTAVPIDTARARISRGLARLRERLERDFGAERKSLAVALLPLQWGTGDSAARGGSAAAAAGGMTMATKAGIAVGASLALVAVAAWIAAKPPAASAPAVAAAPPVAPKVALADDPKPPAPAPAPPRAQEQPAASPAPAKAAETAKEKLGRVMITGTWNDTPVLEVLGEVAAKSDVDFFITAEALGAMKPTPDAVRITMDMSNVPGSNIAEMVTQVAGLKAAIEDSRVVVTSADGKRDESKPLVPIARIDANTKRTITVKGVVVDEHGAAVANAAIFAGEKPDVLATSDAAGAFTFEVGRPFGSVHARVPGRIPSWRKELGGKLGDTVEVRLILRGAAAAVEGVVRDADGREAEKAGVEVRATDSVVGAPEGMYPTPLPIVVTGADGRYRIEGVAPGGFDLVVRSRQGRETHTAGSAKPGETVHVEVTLPLSVTWRGTLRDDDGRPLSGANLNTGRSFARTAKDGTFAVSGLEPGPLTVQVRLADRRADRKLVVPAVAEFERDLWIGGGARIAGRVLDETGAPVARCEIRLLPRTGGVLESGSTTTDAEGRFDVQDLEQGSYRIAVSQGSRVPLLVTAETATGATDVVIRLPKVEFAAIHARLVDADGAAGWPAHLWLRSAETGEVARIETDRLGSLRLERIPRGKYLLWAGTDRGVVELGARDLSGDVDAGTVRLPRVVPVEIKWGHSGALGDAVLALAWETLLGDGTLACRGNVHVRTSSDTTTLTLAPGRYTLRLYGNEVQPFARTIDVRADGTNSVSLPLRTAPTRKIVPQVPGDAARTLRVRISDADGLVADARTKEGAVAVPLTPGRYRVEVDGAGAATLRGEFEVPAEDALERFDVPLR